MLHFRMASRLASGSLEVALAAALHLGIPVPTRRLALFANVVPPIPIVLTVYNHLMNVVGGYSAVAAVTLVVLLMSLATTKKQEVAALELFVAGPRLMPPTLSYAVGKLILRRASKLVYLHATGTLVRIRVLLGGGSPSPPGPPSIECPPE